MDTKGGIYFCVLLFNVVLPVTLLAAAVLRFSAVSFIYTVLLLMIPLLRSPSHASMKGTTGLFLKILALFSVLPVLAQIAFQFGLVFLVHDDEPYGYDFKDCSLNEKLARQFGFQRLNNASAVNVVRLIAPDAATFVVSVFTLFICKVYTRDASELDRQRAWRRKARFGMSNYILYAMVQNLALAAAGCVLPSIFGAVYFMAFLITLTLWGFYKTGGIAHGWWRNILLVYTGLHILILHLYQFPFFQEALDPDDLVARLLGLTAIIQTKCRKPFDIEVLPGLRWSVYMNPALLLILYWAVAFSSHFWRRGLQGVLSKTNIPAKEQTTSAPNSEHQVPLKSIQVEETGSMVFSGSTYGIDFDDETAEDETLVEAEEPPGGRYGGVDKPHAEGEVENAERSLSTIALEKNMKLKPIVSFLIRVVRQSYLLSLIAMMAWSIGYHSWLTFVLLLAACILWMLPNSRKWCLMASPVIVFYAELLLIGGYIFNLNIKDKLPVNAGSTTLNEIGFKCFTDPLLNLGLQIFFTVFMVLSLRQFIYELKLQAAEGQNIALRERISAHVSFMRSLYNIVWNLFCKYWILFCLVMFVVISIQEVVIYTIIYMFLFLMFILTFQLNYSLWRKLMHLFWWVVIIYSMFVLILIYTYQFDKFNSYWKHGTGFDDKVLKDIGLKRFSTAELFVKLLTPTSFLIIIILQVRYFHEPFLQLSALDRFAQESGEEPAETSHLSSTEEEEKKKKRYSCRNWIKQKVTVLYALLEAMALLFWRLCQIHFFKIVVVVIMIVAVREVSVLTGMYVLFFVLLVPFPSKYLILSHLALFWTGIIILAKMIFQLNIISDDYWFTNCTDGQIKDNAEWFGLIKIEDSDISLPYYERFYLLVLLIITLESVVRYHQKQYYNHPSNEQPSPGIIFTHIRRPNADESICNCIKYFANYFFYKFGMEVCFLTTAVVICVRVDGVSVLYGIMMLILLLISRRACAILWHSYIAILSVILIIEFCVLVGIPPGLCLEYPWVASFPKNLELWLFLPDYTNPPVSQKLIADTFQLLFACLQLRVFSIESCQSTMEDYGGGDNKDILDEVKNNAPNPYPDFSVETKTPMDLLKSIVFDYMFWVTMAIIFICGVSRINIYSLFYVLSVFTFMWMGTEFFLKPLKTLLRMWNSLVVFCVMVMFFKAILQLVGCVYIDTFVNYNLCWFIQLLGINCLLSHKDANSACSVEEDDAGLALDAVCFAFLLLQRRIYSSYYFQHIRNTLMAQNKLASRGAEIINRFMIREVNHQKERESKVILKIAEQMKDLKERHSVEDENFQEAEEHMQAIKTGDYFMFAKPENPDPLTSMSIAGEKDEDKGVNPLQVLVTAVDQGAETAVETYPEDTAGIEEEPDGASADPKEQVVVDSSTEKCAEDKNKIMVYMALAYTLFLSIVDWLIRLCNRLSRKYRMVAKKLSHELLIEKQRILTERCESKAKDASIEEKSTSARPDDVHIEMPPEEGATAVEPFMTDDKSFSAHCLDELEKLDDEEIEKEFEKAANRSGRLFKAITLLLASHSQLLCYFLMVLDQMVYGSLLSLPLPLMLFLWGMLSVPRPSKTFWITMITYTEAIVVCKYLFQFGFFPWNDNTFFQASPFFPPRILGIEKKSYYANVDIALLLALFLHRSILKKYGLWRDAADISADLQAAGLKEQTQLFEGDDEAVEIVETSVDPIEQDIDEKDEKKKKVNYFTSPFVNFYNELTQSRFNATVDLYAPMFACDFILFLVLVFGFSSFGPENATADGDVTSYIQDNKIPIPLIIMLIVQFAIIIIDRAIFLRKFLLGKFVFQIVMVIGVHIWMFFLLPYYTHRSFFVNTAAQIWYFIKCIYFAMSAYQIRSGYPNRILGNFLTKKYGYINLFLFKGFLAIPFLLELRSIMDWTWTDSTLAIGPWLQVEDIYNKTFQLKCWREIEKKYPVQRATKKPAIIKYIVGGLLILILVLLIWFPLVLFSFFNSVYATNPPYTAEISINIGGFQPLFATRATNNTIYTLTDAQFSQLKDNYKENKRAVAYLSGFEVEDVTWIPFEGKSLSIWGISPDSQDSLVAALKKNDSKDLMLTVDVSFTRNAETGFSGVNSISFRVNLREQLYYESRTALAKAIEEKKDVLIDFEKIFPRFLQLGKEIEAHTVPQLMGISADGSSYTGLSFSLQSSNESSLSEWWNVKEKIKGNSIFLFNTQEKSETRKNSISFITFNSRKPPAFLAKLSSYGIMGVYISVILVIGRILKSAMTNQSFSIMFRELPDVDRLMQLCLDLYLVREMKNFKLEEDVYAKLIFLYRSPATMIEFTRQTIRHGNIKKIKED